VDKYGWVDIGSSFLPSEITAAFLYAQLENIEKIQVKRKRIWYQYYEGLKYLEVAGKIQLPSIPDFATNNAHMFYIICRNLSERTGLIAYLKKHDILSVFHYISLHSSAFYSALHDGRELNNSDNFTKKLLRLPLYYELNENETDKVISLINSFYKDC
jgi:dTDP-4-amino-4,6-dideoxygalactose transaminase